MTTTDYRYSYAPTPPPARGGPNRLAVLAGLTVLLIVSVMTAWFFAARVLGRQDLDVSVTADPAGASLVRITGSNATVDVQSSPDGQVHVHAKGSYAGDEPQISARTADGETDVTLRCDSSWLSACDIDATVQVPIALAVQVATDNGGVSVDGIDGDLALFSDNGRLEVRGGAGEISATTDNGDVSIKNSRATAVTVISDNGDVDVELQSAPRSVDARTDNGDIDIAVPGGSKYAVDTGADNDALDIDVGIDSDSPHVIKAETDNGDIRIHTS